MGSKSCKASLRSANTNSKIRRMQESFTWRSRTAYTDRGYSLNDVAKRLGVTSKSLRDWVKKYGDNASTHQMISGQQDELRKLKTELRRVTEERNILKEAAAYFASESRKNTHS
jgi:transposase